MWDEKSLYPKIETGYVFTPDMNDKIIEQFNTQTFTQGSVILKVLYYNPSDLLFQYLSLREKVRKTENNSMRYCYIIDTLTNEDLQEIVKLGSTVAEIYEAAIYEKKIRTSPSIEGIEILFILRLKYKDEDIDIMQNFVK